ncbi:citrate synthase [Streptomyces pacificus]|uniref:citrate synthase n=1 Tax=Streptomyces pacificus TaxID=2705029 RepID=UPI0015650A04|nr:citrate synthase [Streptomyces pacificus]
MVETVRAPRRRGTTSVRDDVSDNSVVLRFADGEYTYPVVESTVGDQGFDIGKLRAQTGLVTLDSGYGNTAAYKSAITYLDGEQGILRYRGYPIEQLAERSSFPEVAYLLINGELPTVDQLAAFRGEITQHTLLHEDVKRFFDGFPRDAHPMAMLSSVVSALSTFYQDSHNPFDEEQRHLSTIRLLAKLPTIAAYAYKKSIGHPFVYPRNDLGYVENFLRMTFSVPAQEYEPDPVVVAALDKLLILHADHEQNCSTSTVRLVGSSQANMFASISAGISALWGPLHGGANQSVLEMLEGIAADGGDVDTFIRKVKNKEDGVRLMGFGHRVYKNFDPRAKIIKAAAHDVLSALGKSDELLDIALKLEEHALSDDYFVERKLYPNVDFYTGLIYRAMGFPTEMFTVLFALGRLPGWIAQWHEMIKEPGSRIGRPRQIYTGEVLRDFVPVEAR